VTLPSDVEAGLDRYLNRCPEASVAQVLGRFVLDPDEYAGAVADRLGVPNPTGDEERALGSEVAV